MLGCLAQFSNRFYRQWGKAFVLGLKEAFRSRRLRRALARVPVLSDPDGTAPRRRPSLAYLNQAHPVFAFAPPGATPASGPIEGSSLSISPNRPLRRASQEVITGNGRDGRGRSPGGVSPIRGRRASSPVSHGGNNVDGESGAGGEVEGRQTGSSGQRWSWSHPLRRNRGRALVMENYLRSSEPALQGRRGLMESRGASPMGDGAATPHEGQTTEDMRHVDVGHGSVVPRAPSVRPRQPRKSIRARRRVRWRRVVGVLLALCCLIVGMVRTLRSVRNSNLSWFSAAQGENGATEANVMWCGLEAWRWGSLVKLSEDFLFRSLPNWWSSYVWSDARPPAMLMKGE